jgi:hypothetical protein
MSLLRKLRESLLRRTKKEDVPLSSSQGNSAASQTPPLPSQPSAKDGIPSTSDRAVSGGVAPAFATLDVDPSNLGPPPGHHIQQKLGNAGMQLGVADAVLNPNGPNMGSGIVDGMVIGGIVGQRIDQSRNHAYWKEKQREYLAGNEAAVVNTGVPRTDREIRREERRRKRWSRRA